MAKTFTYEENGLSYTVVVYEQDGEVFADITVDSGFMNVNAVYTADDDFSGDSVGLQGPLNMNGGGSTFEGETVQWDDAIALSRPGLGNQDPDNPTFVNEGETLTVTLDAESVDDVDFFGIRATSTSTPEGSIKAVSGNPEEEEEEEDEDDGEPTFSKVFFAFDGDSDVLGGFPYTAEDLPDDAEGTFADYVALFEDTDFAQLEDINTVIFYTGEDLEEAFRLEGPFEDTEALLSAYDEAIQAAEVDDLMVAFIGDEDAVSEPAADEDEEEVEVI